MTLSGSRTPTGVQALLAADCLLGDPYSMCKDADASSQMSFAGNSCDMWFIAQQRLVPAGNRAPPLPRAA